MVAGCGMTCIKYVVFFVNFLFFVFGAVSVGLGVYALVDKDDMQALTKIDKDGKLDDYNAVGLLQSGAIAFIVGGSFLVVVGFLGCCGAVKEVKCLLGTYAGIVILILIVQCVAAGLAIAYRGKVTDELNESLRSGIKNNFDGNITSTNAFSRAWSVAQVYFDCCGVDNATTDFDGSPWKVAFPAKVVPETCCKLKNRDAFLEDNKTPELENANCPTTAVGDANPNTNKGCINSIEDWVKNYATIIIGIALAIVFIELIAIIFACCLYRSIED